MSDELEKDLPEGNEPEEVEVEEKPELPNDPVDRNEVIDVPLSRQEKKRNRFKEVEERAARAEKAAEDARREAAEARAQFQQRIAHPQDQSHQPQQVHPAAQRLRDIDNATRQLHKEYEAVTSSRKLSAEEHQAYEDRALALQTARISTIAQASAPQVNEQEMYRRWKWNDFTTRHNDVFSNEKAKYWAVSEWQKRVYALGEADTEDLAEKILDETRVKYGMKPRRGGGGPDAATRARLSGVSAQGSGGVESGESGAVRMGARERAMARELYDKDPPNVAYQKWANGPGMRAALKSAGRK